MGNPGPRFAVLLVLLLGAAAGAAARPCTKIQRNAEALDVLPLFAADDISKGNTLGPLRHHGECKVRCNDEEPEEELNTECWGTHLLVCKGNTSIMATKCEGHFLGIHVLDKHMWIGVCEGLSHKFGHWHSTCPKTGRTKRKFFGKGCLGEGSAIIRVHHASNDTESAAPTTVAAALAPTVAITTDPAMDALAAELKRSTARFNSLRIGGDDDEEYKGASFESRCKGRGGDVFGVKWGSHDDDDDVPVMSSDLASVFYYLQGSATESLGTVPEDLQLGSTFPTAAQRAAWRLSNIQLGEQEQAAQDSSIPKSAEQEAAQDSAVSQPILNAAEQVTSTPLVAMVQMADTPKPNHPSCSLTCNDKTPWLKGKWPCYGELSVSCSADAPGGKTMDFSASCKGLWTGMFGKMCWGLTLQHSTTTWPSGEAHMDGICSGKQGIWSHKGGNANEGVFAMGQWCRGGGVSHGSVEKEEADQPAKQVAAM